MMRNTVPQETASEAHQRIQALMEDSYGREETQVIDEEESGRGRTRKRKRDPKSWKRNYKKRLRYAGQEHVGPSGKVHLVKQVGPAWL